MPLVINGEQIEDAVIEHEFGEIKAHHERVGRVSCCERDDEFRSLARDNIIARVLISQKALESTQPPSSEDVDAALTKLMEEHGGEEAFYMNMGITPDQSDLIRENIATSLQVDGYLNEKCPLSEPPNQEDLKAYYEENKEAYMTAPEVRASHIFKSVRMAEDREDMFAELCKVREELKAGADFDATAREHTDKPHDEIDLGWFKRGELMDEFEVMTFSMEVGEVSPVFTTHGSFHIAKVTDKRPARLLAFDEVQDDVADRLRESRREAAIRELVESLKEESVIEEFEEEPQQD